MHQITVTLGRINLARLTGDNETQQRVLHLALPAVGEQMLNMTVGLVNTFLVGHLGAAALAGVGLSNQVIFLATTFFSAVATGTTALVARHVGAGEASMANRILHQSYVLGAASSLVMILIVFLGAEEAMLLLGAQGEVVTLGGTYMRIIAPTLAASALMFIGNAALRGAGDTRTPMKVMGVVNGVNILTSSTLVYGMGPFPALGVAGSALGAALGNTSGCLLVTWILLRGRAGLRLSLGELRPDARQLKRVVDIGLPAGGELLLMRFGMTIFAAVVASLGTAAYAAHQIVLTSESLSFMPGFGFGIAAATLVGQGLGARNPRQAEERALAALRLAIMIMCTLGVIFFVFARQFMGVFTGDPEIIARGIAPLRLAAAFQPFLATMMVMSGALRGAGDTRGPLVVTGLGIWIVRLPLGLLLVQTPLGLAGAWLAMLVDLCLRAVFFFLRFRAGRWKLLRV